MLDWDREAANLVAFGVYLFLSIGELYSSAAICAKSLNSPISEYAHLFSIWVDVLDRFVGKGNLPSTIWVMFLNLVTAKRQWIHRTASS